jgi:enamine deaminase RidA (YjgF/YER057c/UK114 family)
MIVRTLEINRDPWYHSYDYKAGSISSDVAEQAEQTMRNINDALVAAGAGVKDIVRVRYILPDRNDFSKTWPVLQKWLGDVRPAATMIQAGLMEEVMKIEIEVTARKASSSQPTSGTAPAPPI